MGSIDDKMRLDWLEANPQIEISKSREEDGEWDVHAVRGGRNDREWTLLAHHETIRGAIDKAMLIRQRAQKTPS